MIRVPGESVLFHARSDAMSLSDSMARQGISCRDVLHCVGAGSEEVRDCARSLHTYGRVSEAFLHAFGDQADQVNMRQQQAGQASLCLICSEYRCFYTRPDLLCRGGQVPSASAFLRRNSQERWEMRVAVPA